MYMYTSIELKQQLNLTVYCEQILRADNIIIYEYAYVYIYTYICVYIYIYIYI